MLPDQQLGRGNAEADVKSRSLSMGGSGPAKENLVSFLQGGLGLLGTTVITDLQVVLELACPSAATVCARFPSVPCHLNMKLGTDQAVGQCMSAGSQGAEPSAILH